MGKIRVGIVGYGNLGKYTAKNIQLLKDMELIGVFTRRKITEIECPYASVYPINELETFKEKIDILVLCGGSANDLLEQTAKFTIDFNTIDTFDTHAKLAQHFKQVDEIARNSKKISLISIGWDPGLFSLNRVLADSILPNCSLSSFWGSGVSQGHSNAIKRLPNVADAVQFTVPNEQLIQKALKGEAINNDAKTLHKRVCYVVLKENANAAEVKETICSMPDYFAGYETEVNFITQEEFTAKYAGKLPHGGQVIANSQDIEKMTISFNLTLESNPSFTSCVVLAYARAAVKMYQAGIYGAKTILDVPPRYLSVKTYEELLTHYM